MGHISQKFGDQCVQVGYRQGRVAGIVLGDYIAIGAPRKPRIIFWWAGPL